MKSWMGAARSTTSVPDDSIDWGQMVADARTQSPAQETLLTNKIWHFYVRQIIFPGPIGEPSNWIFGKIWDFVPTRATESWDPQN